MTFADYTSSRFDEPHWRARLATTDDGFVVCTPEMARVATEFACGRSFTIHPFQPARHFSACLICPQDGSPVTGGQARAPYAIVPTYDPAFGRLLPMLWRRQAGRWRRVAGFRDTLVAISAMRPLHIAPHWLAADGAVDEKIVDRLLLAEGFVPGRVPGSSLGIGVYDWRRG